MKPGLIPKLILCLLLILTGLLVPLDSKAAEEEMALLGTWKYTGFIYEGQRFPRPNQNLHLTFTFNLDGKERLFWQRDGDDFFCERTAIYRSQDQNLYQKVIWVNPANHSSCGQDPDMRMNTTTYTQYLFQVDDKGTQELHLVLSLNGKPFYYILTRISGITTIESWPYRSQEINY